MKLYGSALTALITAGMSCGGWAATSDCSLENIDSLLTALAGKHEKARSTPPTQEQRSSLMKSALNVFYLQEQKPKEYPRPFNMSLALGAIQASPKHAGGPRLTIDAMYVISNREAGESNLQIFTDDTMIYSINLVKTGYTPNARQNHSMRHIYKASHDRKQTFEKITYTAHADDIEAMRKITKSKHVTVKLKGNSFSVPQDFALHPDDIAAMKAALDAYDAVYSLWTKDQLASFQSELRACQK